MTAGAAFQGASGAVQRRVCSEERWDHRGWARDGAHHGRRAERAGHAGARFAGLDRLHKPHF